MARILVVNPNSTEKMTVAIRQVIESIGSHNAEYTYLTGPPDAPPSIDDHETMEQSTLATLRLVLPLLETVDGVLIACYSLHSLVPALRKHTSKPIVGIFEASMCAALLLCDQGEEWGIVSTGKVWERLLSSGASKFLGFDDDGAAGRSISSFRGVETTGLTASELHERPQDEVHFRMREATQRLIKQGVGKGRLRVVCLGCAGMAGMSELVRAACVRDLGLEEGSKIRIVDGVKAGVQMVEGLIMGQF